MFQKYGSDPIRNLLVDKVESTAIAHQKSVEELIEYDLKRDIDNEPRWMEPSQ